LLSEFFNDSLYGSVYKFFLVITMGITKKIFKIQFKKVGFYLKKAINFLLIFALVFALAACGVKTEEAPTTTPTPEPAGEDTATTTEIVPEEGASLIVWESDGVELDYMRMVGEEFTKRYGVNVAFEAVTHTDAPTKLQTDGPAGLGADVFAAPHDHLGAMVAAGLVLENFYPEEYEGAFMDAALLGTTMDGLLYGYPSAIETYALFYNKDLVTKVPETFDELIEMSKPFNDPSQQKYGFMMRAHDFYFVYSLIGGYGGYVFGDNNTNPSELGLNNEGAVQAAELLQRMKKEILPIAAEDMGDVKGSLFNEGKLMFNLDGPWAVSGHREAGVNFGVAPLPKLSNGKTPTSFSGVRALYVNSYSKYPEAASLFAKLATSEEMLVKRFELTGQLPPRIALLDAPEIKDNEIAAGFLAQAAYAVPMPNIPQMPAVWAPMADALTAIWNDNADPKSTLDAAVEQIKNAMPQ
jgi:arabinogalactan oligomer/maltooligosaccharide transport system substrate-binding protein